MVHRQGEEGSDLVERWDRVFRCVSAEPRRQIIVSLLDAAPGEVLSLPDAAINPNLSVDIDSLRVELYHQHLPLLAENGFVEWDSNPLTVTHGPRFEEVGALFEALHSSAENLPDPLVNGCQRLEVERQLSSSE